MTTIAHVRVTMEADGKTPKRELMFDGLKVGDLTFYETLELVLNAASSLGFETMRLPPANVQAKKFD